jgi:hypothetical protein
MKKRRRFNSFFLKKQKKQNGVVLLHMKRRSFVGSIYSSHSSALHLFWLFRESWLFPWFREPPCPVTLTLTALTPWWTTFGLWQSGYPDFRSRLSDPLSSDCTDWPFHNFQIPLSIFHLDLAFSLLSLAGCRGASLGPRVLTTPQSPPSHLWVGNLDYLVTCDLPSADCRVVECRLFSAAVLSAKSANYQLPTALSPLLR